MKVRFAVIVCAVSMTALLGASTSLSPVADASMKGDRDGTRTLLKQGADVNAAQGDGMTPLHWAADRGDAELTAMLLYAGANVSAVTRIGQYTPLHLASKAGSVAVVQELLKAGADPNARSTTSGVTPLHLAASSGSAVVIDALVEHGAAVNARESQWGQTPLIFAAAEDRVDAIRALLAHKADPALASNTLDITRHLALQRAANDRQKKLLEAIVAKGQQPTPSQVQAAVEASRELYASGKIPPPEKKEEKKDGADSAAAANAGNGANQFNPEEINPPVLTKGGLTPLLHAARQGHLDAAKVLLDGGANVNQVGAGDGTSPLLIAVINGEFDMAMFLLSHGANPNLAATADAVTPLWAAVNVEWQPRTRYPQPQEMERQHATYLDVMKALLDAGADPNARLKSHPWYMVYTGCGNRNCGLEDESGSTPFWRASYATDVDAMKLLVKYGADPNIPTIAPQPPRQRGPQGGAPGADGAGAAANRATGATPRDQPRKDESGLPPVPYGGPGAFPLHAAAGVGYGEGFAGNAHRHAPDGWLPAMKYLIEELGADVNARDRNGYTALHHAASRGDNAAIMYLISKGADVTVVSRLGQTVADMANGPVQRVSPFPETVALLEKLGSKNSHKCVSCD